MLFATSVSACPDQLSDHVKTPLHRLRTSCYSVRRVSGWSRSLVSSWSYLRAWCTWSFLSCPSSWVCSDWVGVFYRHSLWYRVSHDTYENILQIYMILFINYQNSLIPTRFNVTLPTLFYALRFRPSMDATGRVQYIEIIQFRFWWQQIIRKVYKENSTLKHIIWNYFNNVII